MNLSSMMGVMGGWILAAGCGGCHGYEHLCRCVKTYVGMNSRVISYGVSELLTVKRLRSLI